jgi:two-component system NarL family sensor kinase
MSKAVQRELPSGKPARRSEEEAVRQVLLDLHDGPMQLVYAARLQLELLQASLDSEGEPVHRAGQVQRLLERASVELRRIIDQQRAPAAESTDLLTLLRELAAEHQVATRTTVRVLAREHLPDPGPAGRHALYRVLQESLSNAYRHGRAEEVAVQLGLTEQDGSRQLWMSVQDDGTGFDPAVVAEREAGLSGMSERMRSAGGALTVTSAPGTGTTIHAALEVT